MENEKRLIDANALCEGLVENHPVVIYARNAPTVDAVEVVRCKDCKKHGAGNRCNMWKIPHYTMPDDFCSYGERKSGE